jgi:hypothetical protein
MGLFGSVILFGISLAGLSAWRDNRRTARLLSEFDSTVVTKSPQLAAVKEWYKQFGTNGIILVQKLITNQSELQKALEKLPKLPSGARSVSTHLFHGGEHMVILGEDGKQVVRRVHRGFARFISQVLLDSGFVKHENSILTVDPTIVLLVNSLVQFLKDKTGLEVAENEPIIGSDLVD